MTPSSKHEEEGVQTTSTPSTPAPLPKALRNHLVCHGMVYLQVGI
jgi:hypothetical protein